MTADKFSPEWIAEQQALAESATSLKNCPFCGEPPEVVDEGWTVVMCKKCQVSGKAHLVLSQDKDSRVRVAIKSWNTRPAEDVLLQSIERLQKENAKLREACEHALKFIVNGVAIGRIELPDADLSDTANDTEGILRAALKAEVTK